MTTAVYPWEDVDLMVREQVEDGVWLDVEYDAWLTTLFADGEPAAMPASDPLFAEWWGNGAPSVASQWTLLGSSVEVLPSCWRDDWVGD